MYDTGNSPNAVFKTPPQLPSLNLNSIIFSCGVSGWTTYASTIDLARPSPQMSNGNTTQRTARISPHDTILAELQGEGGLNSDPKAILQNEPSSPPQAKLTSSNSGDLARLRFMSNSSLSSNPLFDPFTGARIGDLVSTEDRSDPDTKTDEDIWSHLSQILKLQSDIAEKHIKMEGIELKKPRPTPGNKSKGVNRRPGSGGGRVWGDGAEQGVDEGVEEEGEEEIESRKREQEFTRLNDKFAGRKDAIDGIMKDVGVLKYYDDCH